MHTLVRVSEKDEEKEISVEERLRLVEDELARMGQLLARLVEKSTEGSPSDPLTKDDLQAAVIEVGDQATVIESDQPEEEPEMAEEEPETVAEEPETVVEEPETVVEEPERVVEEPEPAENV